MELPNEWASISMMSSRIGQMVMGKERTMEIAMATWAGWEGGTRAEAMWEGQRRQQGHERAESRRQGGTGQQLSIDSWSSQLQQLPVHLLHSLVPSPACLSLIKACGMPPAAPP